MNYIETIWGKISTENIPEVYYSDAKDIASFCNHNFKIVEADGHKLLICDPLNSAAMVTLVSLLATGERKDLILGDEYIREAFPEGSAGKELQSQVLEWQDDAGFVQKCIKEGVIFKYKKGEKYGPFPVNCYGSNDYLILPDFEQYLKGNKKLPSFDEEIDSLMSGYVFDACISSGMTAAWFIDPFLPKLLDFGWFEETGDEELLDTLGYIVSGETELEYDVEDKNVIRNIYAVADYLRNRGHDIDGEDYVLRYKAYIENIDTEE